MDQNIEKKKKKWVLPLVIILVIVLVVAGVVGFFLTRAGGPSDDYGFYDDSYTIDGDYSFGMTNYYAGVVEAQETQEVQKDASKEVDEIFVAVGDEVKKGDPLFSYKTDDLKLDIERLKLEIENSATSITEYNNQIDTDTRLMNEATDATVKAKYQLAITETQNSIRQVQLEQRAKNAEIDAKQKSIDNAVVKSTVDGVIKSISTSSTDSGPYMTILGTGSYRVKGTVDEMNVGMLSEGLTVTVHSRVDQSKTWEGKITKIDTEDVNKNNNNNGDYYYGGGSSGESATKYSFYVELTSTDDLLLGQHVYIEPSFDYGDMSEDSFMEEEVTEEGSEAGSEEITETIED